MKKFRNEYIEFLTANGRSAASVNLAKAAINRFYRLTGKKPHRASAADLSVFIEKLQEECFREDSRKKQKHLRGAVQIIDELRRQWRYYKKTKLLAELNCLDVRRVLGLRRQPPEERAKRGLNRQELSIVIDAIRRLKTPWLKAAMFLLAATGCRASEICCLRIGNIEDNGKTLFIEGKGGRDGYVPVIWEEARQVLMNYVKNYRAGAKPNDFVFRLWGFDSPPHVSIITFDRNINKVLESCGLKRHGISAHTFRHSFATHCIESGVRIETVQKLLRHANLATTNEIYNHQSLSSVREEVAAVGMP